MEKNKPSSVVERLKEIALQQKREKLIKTSADSSVRSCTNCGAPRGKLDGLTKCAYCGFEFLEVKLTDGIHIQKEDNSK